MKFVKQWLRKKKRYLYFEIDRETGFDEFEKEFEKQFRQLLGEKGFAEANPLLIRNLWKGTFGVLRVNHEHVTSSKIALTLVRRVKSKSIIVKTGKVYGTLKKLKSEVK